MVDRVGSGGSTAATYADDRSRASGIAADSPVERLLARPSTVDRLLAQPNIISRLERGYYAADPAAQAQPGFTMRAGDTMADIAARHAIPIARVLDLNPQLTGTLRPTDPLRAGDRINLPAEVVGARGVTRARDADATLGVPDVRVEGSAGAAAAALDRRDRPAEA